MAKTGAEAAPAGQVRAGYASGTGAGPFAASWPGPRSPTARLSRPAPLERHALSIGSRVDTAGRASTALGGSQRLWGLLATAQPALQGCPGAWQPPRSPQGRLKTACIAPSSLGLAAPPAANPPPLPRGRRCRLPQESLAQLKSDGNSHFAKKEYDAALAAYDKALGMVPADAADAALLHSNKAACHMMQKRCVLVRHWLGVWMCAGLRQQLRRRDPAPHGT